MPPSPQSYFYTHVYTHGHTHVYTHVHTHVYTHAYTRVQTRRVGVFVTLLRPTILFYDCDAIYNTVL